MQFQLLCKDNVVAEFEIVRDGVDDVINITKVLGNLPVGYSEANLDVFIEHRNATKHRHYIQEYLQRIGANTLTGFLAVTHGISVNDCYWVRAVGDTVYWDSVSPYTRDYDEVVQKLAFNGVGLYGGQLTSISPEFGTSGTFAKCWIREDDRIYLIKRGSDFASNSGLEPYCEVLASQVFTAMKTGIPYRLVHYHGKVASKCRLFNNERVSFTPYNILTSGRYTVRNILEFYEGKRNSEWINRILVCDALTFNTDRHGGNHGMLCDSMSGSYVSVAPGYDYNLALLPYFTTDDIACIGIKGINQQPKVGNDFLDVARYVMTPEIRRDLINLRGIELELPFYDDKFGKERAEWMTALVNAQIDNVLSDKAPVYPDFHISDISNCMKYRIGHDLIDEDKWVMEVPRLMQKLGISHMVELEEEIVKYI